ncbi:MAG TPA: SsgA family sporulation/cell division regulator [Actinomycetes bacterium]
MPSTVTRELTVQLVAPGDGSVSLPVVFHYDTEDPYAVHANFRTGQGDGVSWVFARELLTLGVNHPSGDGDVRVWPSWSAGAEVVFIGLTSPDGEALLQASTRELVDFLGRTYALCPQGQEREHLDVDRAIEALLAS